MGRWLRSAGHLPDQVLCSSARRARETWRLAQQALGTTPPVTYDDGVYQASAAELLGRIRRTPPAVRTLLVVGHDPGLPGLALALAAPTAPPADAGVPDDPAAHDLYGRMRAKFPTAAVVVLEFTGNWDGLSSESARLANFVVPREIRAPAQPDENEP
jgi:phosphohistidine phosphatase